MAHLPRGGGLVWPPVMATWAPGGTSRAHAHHAMHILLRARGDLAVNGTRAAGVLTAPSVPHATDAAGEETLLCFVEPESDVGAALLSLLDDRPIRLFSAAERERLVAAIGRAQPMPARAEGWLRAELPKLGVTAPMKRAIHPGVRRVLRMLRDEPDCDTALAALARAAGLSPGRFMHVFTESMGIALRPYLLWRKLQRAAFAVVSGRPLAEAAAFGGFSDGAHMTRAFRRMFGVTPSEMQNSQFVQAQKRPGPSFSGMSESFYPRHLAAYAHLHQHRTNLLLHAFAVPIFFAAFWTIPIALAFGRWGVALAAASVALVSIGIQGRGHGREAERTTFRGPGDFVTRLLVEQLLTFPRFVLSGGYARAWRASAPNTGTALREPAP